MNTSNGITILFVCTGNTCRSPMAEVIFNEIAKKRGEHNSKAISAGIYPMPGDPATAGAIHAVKKLYGLDLRGHRSRLLDESDLRRADLVLAMTTKHVACILDAFPELPKDVHTLKEFAAGYSPAEADVGDPYGASLEQYCACAEEIYEAINRVADKLFNPVSGHSF